jgi:AbrB family looped-hinge helix DNA binding protein
MYTTKITSQGTISIPAPLRKKYGFEVGQTVVIEDNEKITISKTPDIARVREENKKFLKPGYIYKSGDGFAAHVKEKYAKE